VKSRRLSNISTQLPNCPPLFVDRTFGSKKLATELRKMGFDVRSHDDHFNKRARDEYWLPRVGKKNWRVLTADQEMESLHHAAIVDGNVGVFILSNLGKGDTYERWVQMIALCQLQIHHACCRSKRPFVGRISREGKLWRIKHLKTHNRTEDITGETAVDAANFGLLSVPDSLRE
jgi:hypothetical protein